MKSHSLPFQPNKKSPPPISNKKKILKRSSTDQASDQDKPNDNKALEILNTWSDQASDQAANLAKPNETKENVNFESITNGATNLANDKATVGATVGAGELAIGIIGSNLNDKVLQFLIF